MISYVVNEAAQADISQIIFILNEQKKNILECFKKKQKLESVLKKRGQNDALAALRKFEEHLENVSFLSVNQPQPRGDGDAVLKAKKQIGKEPFAVLFSDDLFESKKPALAQLKKIFQTSQKTIVGLKRLPKEEVSKYGVVKVEKIASRLYKIKDIVEKPSQAEAPSDLVIAGRYILLPEIFGYLQKTEPNKKNEIILAEALKLMLKDGKIIYGYEIEGQWLECGKTEDWLKSSLYLALHHPRYGPILREWLKKGK